MVAGRIAGTRLPGETWRALADALPFAIWGDDKSCRFLRALMDLDPDADLVEVIADALHIRAELFGLPADEVLSWLLERARRVDRPTPALIGTVGERIPNAVHPDEAVDLLAETLLSQLYRAEGSAAVAALYEQVKPHVELPQKLVLGRALAELYLQPPPRRGTGKSAAASARGEGAEARAGVRAQNAVEARNAMDARAGVDARAREDAREGVEAALYLLTELLGEALQAGDAYEAEELARRIDAVCRERGPGCDETVMGIAEESVAAFRRFMADWQPHRAAILADIEQKALDLQERWRDKTVLLFTGHEGDHLEERLHRLEELLDLEVEVHGLHERGVVESLQPGRHVVVLLPRWAGHADTGFIEEACHRRKVACYTVPQRAVNPERIVREIWGR
jgi:hypothetical protein